MNISKCKSNCANTYKSDGLIKCVFQNDCKFENSLYKNGCINFAPSTKAVDKIINEQIEFLSMLIVQFGDILGDPLIVLIDEQIKKLKAIVKK